MLPTLPWSEHQIVAAKLNATTLDELKAACYRASNSLTTEELEVAEVACAVAVELEAVCCQRCHGRSIRVL